MYEKPAGELFEMSYLKKFKCFVVRVKGLTVVFGDENEL